MGQWGLHRVQWGAESTKGTAVSAAKILTNLDGQIEDLSEKQIKQLEYYSGLLAGDSQNAEVFVSDMGQIPLEGDATYESLAYWLNAGWKAVTATTSAGSANWDFTPPTSAANVVKTFTMQAGDNTETLTMNYCFLSEWELSAETNDTTKLSGTMLGRQVQAVASFSAATAISATPMAGNLWKLYSDAVTGTVGTTQISATLRKFSLKNTNGFHQKNFMDGVLYPTSDGQARPELSFEATYEYNANATQARTDWKANTQKRVRLLHGASPTANPSFYADLPVTIEKVNPIEDSDGNTTVVVNYRIIPVGATTADFARFVLNNSLTSGL